MEASVMMAAGGSGGHLFPALALAQALVRRGFQIDLITDMRGTVFGSDFPSRSIHRVPAATFRGRSPLEAMRTMATNSNGFKMAYNVMGQIKPNVIVGFGGYPTLAPMLAAALRGIPTLIHEQNAVMGRANRVLAPFVKAIGCSFDQTKFLEGKLLAKAHLIGTPLRDSVIKLRGQAYRPPSSSSQLNLLVFGGSQGAQFFSEIMPAALSLLPSHMRDRLMVVQQCRPEDLDRVFDMYEAAGVAAELSTFFEDLPQKIFETHLVISRGGASTIAELCAIGRPALVVPLPHAIDNDQLENARRFEAGGAGWCMEQAALTPERMAGTIRRLFEEPLTLVKATTKATAMAHFNAVDKLANLVMHLAMTPPEKAGKPGDVADEVPQR
jgi:UDP-N-acetylglucosamine--N-acetylmuramyl-(pentapeptide) pyrophosphoryl-undecaprenol N-acetylglucosamine transferase